MATPWPDKPCPSVFLKKIDTTPEEWVGHDKGMPGALRGYKYAEDF